MVTKSKKNDRRGRRHGGHSRSGSSRSPRPKVFCSLCQELIKDICSASARPMDGSAVHFDCAIKAVEQILKPRKGEKVIYQGKGCFAVVDDHAYQNRGLKILRNTDWENLEKAAEWRKSLRTTIR